MTYEIATVACGGPGLKIPWDFPIRVIDNRDNRMTPCEAYQVALDQTMADVLIMCHDDLTVFEEKRYNPIVQVFDNRPDCVAVGLGGALSLGNKDLYRKPFNIWNMARGGYASNATDAETHGERSRRMHRCAVLDAYLMAVKVDWLRARGGWPVDHLSHHCLDLWLACEAARDDKEIWQVGVSCTHHGGGTSTKPEYANAKWLQGNSMEGDHIAPHKWLWREYIDVLPIVIGDKS